MVISRAVDHYSPSQRTSVPTADRLLTTLQRPENDTVFATSLAEALSDAVRCGFITRPVALLAFQTLFQALLPRSFLPGPGGGPGISNRADKAELDELERRMARRRKSFAADWMSEYDRQVMSSYGPGRHDA